MEILVDDIGELVTKQAEGGGEALACVYYSFKPVGEASCLTKNKELKESMHQWGMSDTLSVTQMLFAPGFMPHEESSFLRQLLASEQESLRSANSKTNIQSVQWEELSCSVVSMDFFDCLIEKGIVSESGNIRGCYDETFDGVTVSDKLRELLANPASENADAVFSKDQKRELLFHLFKALCIGGAICQPSDKLEAYTNATKTLYKALVSVRKNTSTGNMEISPCKVYRVIGLNGDDKPHHQSSSARLFPNAEEPDCRHHVCLVVADLGKRRASVVRKEFVPFWS